MDPKIAIVDDHPLIRRGMTDALTQGNGLRFGWSASSIAEAEQKMSENPPAVVVVDLTLTDGSGLDLIKTIREQYPNTKVLVSSMKDERVYAGRCLKAGASGYVSKDRSVEQLLSAIHTVLSGSLVVTDAVLGQDVVRANGDHEKATSAIGRLSDRELQVLELMGVGKDTKEIADVLNVSKKTVDSFRERMKHKLGLSTGKALMHFALNWSDE